MKIVRMLAPVHSLGPGNRVCLWTKGCSKKCPGCISPEMQSFEGDEVPEEMLAGILVDTAKRSACKGLTISGGDPFEQSEALLRLLKQVRPHFDDILVYTGFLYEEIKSGAVGEDATECLKFLDVLIDGPYVEERNFSGCVLRGSENQTICYFNENLKPEYEAYLQAGRQLEVFTHNESVVVTGIMNRKEDGNE